MGPWIFAFRAPLVSASWLWARNFSASMWETPEASLSSFLAMTRLLPKQSAEIRNQASKMRLLGSYSVEVGSIPSGIQRLRHRLGHWECGWRTMTFRDWPWQGPLETRWRQEWALPLSQVSQYISQSLSICHSKLVTFYNFKNASLWVMKNSWSFSQFQIWIQYLKLKTWDWSQNLNFR